MEGMDRKIVVVRVNYQSVLDSMAFGFRNLNILACAEPNNWWVERELI